MTRIRSFTDEMKELGIVPGTSYAHMELVKADQHLAKVFQVEPDVPLYRLERVRTGDGKPIVISRPTSTWAGTFPWMTACTTEVCTPCWRR